MKNNILFLLFMLLFSCSTIKGVKINQAGKKCLDGDDIRKIIENQPTKGTVPSHLFIEPIIVNENNCIGLYGINFKNPTVSARVVQKVLKFKNDLYIYSDDGKNENQLKLLFFKKEYLSFFTKSELDDLTESFDKGIEIDGRLY